MKIEMKARKKEIFRIKRLPLGITAAKTWPSRSDLVISRAFGKPNLAQSYSVPKSLSHIAVLLWKYSFFDDTNETLAEAYGSVGEVAYKRIKAVADIDFSALQLLPLDWDIKEGSAEEEDRIQDNKSTMLDACLVHYNMDLEMVQRFCGGR